MPRPKSTNTVREDNVRIPLRLHTRLRLQRASIGITASTNQQATYDDVIAALFDYASKQAGVAYDEELGRILAGHIRRLDAEHAAKPARNGDRA